MQSTSVTSDEKQRVYTRAIPKSPQTRERLAEQHLPLVRRLCERYR